MSNEITLKANSLRTLLKQSEKEIAAALPRHLTPERMLRIAMTEARKVPALLDCTPASFIGAIIQCAQLGLEPGGALGHAYLIPFNNKKNNSKEVQFIVGYRGMIELAGRSQRCSHIVARPVYAMDTFEFEYGLEEKLVHKPSSDPKNTVLTHVYAIVFLKDGGKVFQVMNYDEIEATRKRSKSSDFGPWSTDYEAMALKTAVRRLFKFTPVSIEIQQAIGFDEEADRGEQDNGSFIEAEGGTIEDPADKGKAVAAAMASKKPEQPKPSPEKEPEPTHAEALGAEPEVIPEPPKPAPGEFDANNPPKMRGEEPPAKRTRKEIGISIMELAKKQAKPLGINEINDHCLKAYKKPMNAISEAQMEDLEQNLAFGAKANEK